MKKRLFIILFSVTFLMIIISIGVFADKIINSDSEDLMNAVKKANSNEKNVIAVVEGKEIYQETIDFLATGEEIALKNSPSTTNDSIPEVNKDEILKKQIRNAVVLAEAERLGLSASIEDAEKYTNENYNMVKEAGGQTYELILDYMETMEMSEDEYLKKSAEVNRNMLTRANLYNKFIENKTGTYDELVAEYEKYVEELVKKANIEYPN